MRTILLVLALYTSSIQAQDYGEVFIDIENNPEIISINENLKTLDLDFYPKNNLDRPGHCSLKAESFSDLLGRMKSLLGEFGNSECTKNNAELVAIVDGTVDQIDDIELTEGEEPVEGTDPIIDEQTGDEIASVVSTLGSLADSAKCDFKDMHFVPVLSEILMQLSTVAFLVPAYGPAIGGATALTSSTMNVLYTLLKNPFDWKNEADRDVFLNSVCSFYDLREELNRLSFLGLYTDKMEGELATRKLELSKVLSQRGQVLELKTSLEDRYNLQLQTYLNNEWGVKENSIVNTIEKSFEMVNEDILAVTEREHRLEIVKEFFSYRTTLLKNISGADLGEVGNFYKKEIQGDIAAKFQFEEVLFHEDELPVIANKYFVEFIEGWKLELDSLLTTMNVIKSGYVESFNSIMISESLSIGDYYTSSISLLVDLDTSLLKFEELLNLRIAFINEVEEEQQFTTTDEGTKIKQALYEKKGQIEQLIFGSRGFGFFKYVHKKAKTNFKRFNKKWKRYADKYKDIDFIIDAFTKKKGEKKIEEQYGELKDEILMDELGCANAKNLRDLYKVSIYNADLAYDFLRSNADYFHSNEDKYNKLLWVLPIGFSPEYKLLNNSLSAIFAKKFIEGQDPEELGGFKKHIRRKYIGNIMIKLNLSKDRAVKTQDYIDEFCR